METITISITGHTNAGKTALGRTLLCRDIGEVRDAPHVTTSVETHDWIATDQVTIRIADTPGFDSAGRLLRRMRQARSPVGWFLREVWDRVTDPDFYLTQLAVRHVSQTSDLVLHVVDIAAEHAGPSANAQAEIELLALVGKPVIVVLNQTGRPWTHAEAAAEETRWREICKKHAVVRDVLILDAFTRCWPAELILIEAAARVLPEAKAEAMLAARDALVARHLAVFEASVSALVDLLRETSADGESMAKLGLLGNARRVVSRLFSSSADARLLEEAHKRLKNRLSERMVQYVNTLVQVHGIGGQAERREILEQGQAAFTGGEGGRLLWRDLMLAAAGGATAGGAIDAAVGGASFMAGAMAGAVLGTLTAIGLGARGLASDERGRVVWNAEAMVQLAAVGMRSYLAVAHFGRGQGSWRDHDGPEFWAHVIDEVMALHREALVKVMREDDAARLHQVLADMMLGVLRRLYPAAPWAHVKPAAGT